MYVTMDPCAGPRAAVVAAPRGPGRLGAGDNYRFIITMIITVMNVVSVNTYMLLHICM